MKQKVSKFIWNLFLAFLTVASVNGQTNPNPNPALDEYILDEMNFERFPGASTVIVKDNKIVWIQSYGFADVENAVPVSDSTVFLLASVSKVFTGTAAMQLFENNVIDLDEDVNLYLPWTLSIPGFSGNPVTFRHLMTHTSSIRDNYTVMETYYDNPDPTISLADCMHRYFSTIGIDYEPGANFLPNAPGSIFEYSNMGTALNGYLVELASGMPFDQYCNLHIFDKLCMNKTSWFFSEFDSAEVARPYQYTGGSYVPYPHYGFADYPDGQLRSNVTDLAKFMIAYLNGGTFGANSILSASSINQMWSPQIPAIDQYQGLNWYQEELYHDSGTTWLWGHNGGEMGVSTELYLDPVNKIGVCVLTNGEGDALYICDELYNYALTLNSTNGIAPECLTTNIPDIQQVVAEKKLIKIIDFFGRETSIKPNTPLIKIYSDGSSEKIFIVE
ncbi:MAG: beta-lactamase family protein [Sphingobacteriales bacterium]|nr:MAG: beta-lactamase family protein [Sphingobacteriales bacterium]